MKINSSNVQLQANSSFIQKHKTYEEVTFFSQNRIEENNNSNNSIKLNINHIGKTKAINNYEDNLSPEDKIKKKIIELLLEQISNNKKTKLHPHENSSLKTNHNNPYNSQIRGSSWGMIYESSEEYYQKSTIEFSATANIKAGNKEFSINLNFSYTQEFYEVHKERIEIGVVNKQDPLLINFGSNLNSFDNISKDMNFLFDINNDGNKDLIPLLKNGTGFLALDKNQNGSIDNGSELFGPNTNNGFAELKEYDLDSNNWIDENDSIFNNLRIWQKDESGNNSLIGLGQVGIGAIFLSSVNSGFNYANSIENETAILKESSFFLKENGDAGLITSVDFTI